jgi:hypothetical protein
MKKFFQAIFDWLIDHWRGLISAIIVIVIAVLTLSIQLNTLLPGINEFEYATLQYLQNILLPWHRAVNAPYFVPAHLIGDLLNNALLGARITSVIFGLASAACLFYVIKLWFNVRIATVGALLLLTSSWFLTITHLALPTILLIFMPLVILASLNWYLQTKKYTFLAFSIFMISLAVGAYVPYVPWIILVSLLILIVKGRDQLKNINNLHLIIAGTLYFAVLIPLFISLVGYPGQIRELVGIPAHWPTIQTYFSHLGLTISMIFVYSPPFAAFFLGRLPMLDIFSTVMFILGVYYYACRIKYQRSIILLFSFLVLILIIPLSPIYQITASVLLPLIYIVIITGVVELLNQWYSYFPRNPWARNIGVVVVVIAIGFTTFYQLQRYYIAWPAAPATKAAYQLKAQNIK